MFKYLTGLAFSLLFFTACQRSPFLDVQPDRALVVPTTLPQLQALLDYDRYMNGAGSSEGLLPSLGEIGSDNYYVTDADYNNLSQLSRQSYTWAPQVFANEEIPDWNFPYRAVFYANVVMEGLQKLVPKPAEEIARRQAYAAALFYRAHAFYGLTQVFAPPYRPATAATDWGIPLRLQADISEPLQRATVQQTYDRITGDLKEALRELPTTPLYKTRPSVAAGHALLARVYLAMQDYEKALLHADSCLQLHPALLDYNTVNGTPTYPLPRFNEEVLFHANLALTPTVQLIHPVNARIDSGLYRSYAADDLRRTLFFRTASPSGFRFRGSYDGSINLFGGLATNEVYLTRAECHARLGNKEAALRDLNALLAKRWKRGTFVPLTAATPKEALDLVLEERRKELIMRGLRWTDLRRLSNDPGRVPILYRTVNGQTHALPPGDPRYVYPIPPVVIGYHPGMPQNPR